MMVFNLDQKKQSKKGYVALISAIIISVLLILIGATLNLSLFFSRFNTLNSEYKKQSLALAEACLDMARLKLAENFSYNGNNEEITIDGGKCFIVSVSQPAPYTIKTRGIYPIALPQKSYSNIQAVVDYDLDIVSWEEVPKF